MVGTRVRACVDICMCGQGLGREFDFNQTHMTFIRQRVIAQVGPKTVTRRIASQSVTGGVPSELLWRCRGEATPLHSPIFLLVFLRMHAQILQGEADKLPSSQAEI